MLSRNQFRKEPKIKLISAISPKGKVLSAGLRAFYRAYDRFYGKDFPIPDFPIITVNLCSKIMRLNVSFHVSSEYFPLIAGGI